MSQNLEDDLEEGEIADDVVIIDVIEKPKKLPRRYDLNEEKSTSKHKKNCKYSALHHKQKSSYIPHKKSFSKKQHKACSKHDVKQSDCSVKSLDPYKESFNFSFKHKRRRHKYPKIPLTKSAFKNYMSPPRKVSKFENLKLTSCSPSVEVLDNYPKLLSEYKKSRAELNKLKNISNIKEQPNLLSPKESCSSENKPSTNGPTSEKSKATSDDEDEEELRRLALATCLKRQEITRDIEMENSCKANGSMSNVASDNYEVVDMEMGNSDIENVEENDNLFVIDTTPSYFCGAKNSSISLLDSNPITNFSYLPTDGFLPNLNLEGPVTSYTSETFCPDLNNDLYSNFDLVSEDSPLPSSQLDDDFEEELLRAELLASMNSNRQIKSECSNEKNNVSLENKISKCMGKMIINSNCTNKINLTVGEKVSGLETKHTEENIVSKKSDNNQNDTAGNDKTAALENIICSDEKPFKDERIVSIVSDLSKIESSLNDRTRSVTAVYSKHDLPHVPSIRKKIDLKVKVNNVSCSSLNDNLPSSKVTLPQERLIISLNNESSSDDSDDEDKDRQINTGEDPAVASIEALIANARNESDGKINNSNSSDAVSWLSKAQQEEYNSLKKILDAKKQHLLSQAKIINNAENNGLNLLKRKLLIAKKNLEKEKELMTFTMKDLMKKKRSYMLSKLKVQQLKEQLIAADRVRKSNLQLWTKCSSNLQALKKSVTKREAIIISIQSKINSFFSDFSPDNCSDSPNHLEDLNSNISS